MQIKPIVLRLFAVGLASEASIDFEPAFHVDRIRIGGNQEAAIEHQRTVLLAAEIRQRFNITAQVVPVRNKFAPFYDQAMMLPLSNAKHRAMTV